MADPETQGGFILGCRCALATHMVCVDVMQDMELLQQHGLPHEVLHQDVQQAP